jgi:cell division protein FtsW (lipid II flippase)
MNNKKVIHDRGSLLLFFCSCIIMLLFARLYSNLQPYLIQMEQQYKAGNALNLQAGIDPSSIRNILDRGNYYADINDIDLVADSLPVKLKATGNMVNLGALNKQEFFISAPVTWNAELGGRDFEERFHASLLRLGFDSSLFAQELSNQVHYPSTVFTGKGNVSISGVVKINDNPVKNVLIQLKQHIAAVGESPTGGLVTYGRTDTAGRFVFYGLYKGSGYSVLPLKPGYEFGPREGFEQLEKPVEYTFNGHPHQIRLIGSSVYGQLKENKAFTVRTPATFRSIFWIITIGFILSFWVVQIFWNVRKFPTDFFLLPVLMLLTGISSITLLSMQDALQDTLYAWQALQGVLIGLAGLAILSQVNFGKIYTSWWFDWLFNFKKSIYNLQGWTWLVLAILMAFLTLYKGSGPEGSGVKVNLQLGGISFQPSEITKYLILLFFAGFFAANEQKLRSYQDLRWRFITSWMVMAGTGVILTLYLLMGDMGPALVVCLTFVIFYSLVYGSLAITMTAAVGYGILLWTLPDLIATIISFAGVIFILFRKGNIKSTKWYGWLAASVEPPVLMLLILAAFAFGDKLPGVGSRLADRKNMWLSQWSNDIYGGDQIAHAYWTLSSGGFSGQGLGKGFANTMPAAHTDMILPSIGEEVGWLGLVAVFVLMGILIHRALLHARRAGQPFSFYLCAGLAVATGVQFLLISAGSTGLIPLTGITVPFLSYGKISLIVNLAAMGIIASIASRAGEEAQKEYIIKYYDPVLLTGIAGFLIGILILTSKLAWVQIWSGKEYIVKPARVVDRYGEPVFSYDPRINELTKILKTGDLFDRNRLLLATSDINDLKRDLNTLQHTGLDSESLNELTHKKLRRYYPFGEHMFFWVGDFNTRLFWHQGNGYFAEEEHLSTLRGFRTNMLEVNSVGSHYKPDRFTKPISKQVKLIAYDYSELASILRSGIDSDSEEIEKLAGKKKDVQLTVDAKLQVALQHNLAVSDFRDKRISVVVMDAKSGDLLASAVNPLPDLHAAESMLVPEKERYPLITERDLGMTFPTAPGSTVKILTAMAAFKHLGPLAAGKAYNDISRSEIIRNTENESEPYVPKVPTIDMHEAIIRSSNVYFIRMANDYRLDNELIKFYLATGMNVGLRGGYSFSEDSTANNGLRQKRIIEYWKDSIFSKNRDFYTDKNRQGKRNRYYSEFSGLAWGQGQLTSTPASMARMACIVANGGNFQPTRYVMEKGGIRQPLGRSISMIANDSCAKILKNFMVDQSNLPGDKPKIDGTRVAGKTGTPERIIKSRPIYDCWYVFFAPVHAKNSFTVVCVRIESGRKSANAVALANKEIAPVLRRMGYLDSF